MELWEAAAGRSNNSLPAPVVADLEHHDSRVNALAVLPDGHRVAVGVSSPAGRNGIVVWDTLDARHDMRIATTGTGRATIACTSGVRALAVARNGCLVAECKDGKLRVVDVDTRAIVSTLGEHSVPVKAVAVLLDDRVASAADDGKVRLWDVDTGACVSTLDGYTGRTGITSLAVLADGRLATGCSDQTVRLWDTASGVCIRVLTGHTNVVTAVAVLPGNQLASASDDGTIRVGHARRRLWIRWCAGAAAAGDCMCVNSSTCSAGNTAWQPPGCR